MARGQRALLVAFGSLSSLAVGTMYVLAESTDRFFAWTINPPLTAAFLGAGYGAGLVAVAVALRRGQWGHVRVGVQAIFAFVVATTAATLIHLDRFHFDAEGLPRAAAWVWLVVYLVVPVWIAVALAQTRAPRAWRARSPLPAPVVVALVVQGVALGGLGLVLFAAPGTAEVLWPWLLTPLTARVAAAWLLALAVAALLATREQDVTLLEVPAAIYATFALLQAGALARFRDQVAWDRPAAWLLLLFLAIVAATGLAGSVHVRARTKGGVRG